MAQMIAGNAPAGSAEGEGDALHGDGVLDDVGLVAVEPNLGECVLARPLALFAWGMG